MQSFEPGKNAFTIEVKCSKGTYIRSLAVDIGRRLGCLATMGELVRTASGMFAISHAKTLDEIKEAATNGRLNELVMPVDELLPFPKITIHKSELKAALNGNAIQYTAASEQNGLRPFLLPTFRRETAEQFPGIEQSALARAFCTDQFPSGEQKYWVYCEGELIGLYKYDGKYLRVDVMMNV